MKANEIRTMEQLAEYINEKNAEYENNNVLDESETIAKKNGWSLGISLPYVCYNDSERLMYENGMAEVYTKMKPEEVTTLERFADYINEREEWEDSMWDIMELNGWNDCDNDYDICESDSESLTLGHEGEVYVTSK